MENLNVFAQRSSPVQDAKVVLLLLDLDLYFIGYSFITFEKKTKAITYFIFVAHYTQLKIKLFYVCCIQYLHFCNEFDDTINDLVLIIPITSASR